jgi:hypothetical protein
MKINGFFGNEGFISRLIEKLENVVGELNLVLAEYKEPGFARTDYKGLDIALSLKPQEAPIILCSFMPENYFLENESTSSKYQALMAKKRVGYLRLPFDTDQFLLKYNELLNDNKEEDLLAIEINNIEILQNEMGTIRHSIGHLTNADKDSDYSKVRIAKALIDGRKIGLSGSDEEVIDQIMNFNYQPISNSYMVGKFFPGVFCDVENTLLINGEVNSEILNILNIQSRKNIINLWTGGDLKEIKKILLKNHITWKLVSKYSFAGAEIESAIDDEDYSTFQEKYGVKVRNYHQI